MNQLQQIFIKEINKHISTAEHVNHQLATHPELSGQEYESSKLLCTICESAGMNVERDFIGLPTAFRANVVRANNPQGKLAILCEYDALPDIGHGCGHCASGSMSLLAALTLHEMYNTSSMANSSTMDIDLIGTPDEEATGCKVDMVKAGIFKDYDYAIMVHLDGIESRAKAQFLALDNFRVRYHGKTAHAASNPWDGVNALNSVQLALTAIDMLRQQVRPETRIGSWIITGGKAANVIPDFAEFECCIRHTDRQYLNTVTEKVKKIFEAAAMATGTTVDYTFYGNPYDNMNINQNGITLLEDIMTQLNIDFNPNPPTELGSSDIGSVSFQCPAFHPYLRLAGTDKVCHTIEFANAMLEPTITKTIQEGAMIIGVSLLELMSHPQKLRAIKEEFYHSINNL